MAGQTIEIQQLEGGFGLDDFLIEPNLQRIYGRGQDIRVEPKVMDVLVRLAASPGETVTKQEFMKTVWEDTIVTDDALLRCISELRKILNDDAKAPRYIETIRKKGYRLVAPVSPAPDTSDRPSGLSGRQAVSASSDSAPPTPTEKQPPLRTLAHTRSTARYLISGGIVTVVLLAVVIVLLVFGGSDTTVPASINTVPLTSYPGVESDPNLSPDGSRVAFIWDREDGGSFDVFIKQIGVETPLRLTRDPADDGSPAWSPDGQHIAFVRTRQEHYGLYILPAVGGSERLVADFGNRAIQDIAWSPASPTLALAVQRIFHSSFGISLFSIDTLEERVLTQPPMDYRGDMEPAFSPDGKWLAFVRSNVEKVDDIYVVPASGGELKRLTFDHAEITGLDWTRDGRFVVFTSDRAGAHTLWRVPATGGRPTWIPTSGESGGIREPSLSRQIDRMTFVRRLQETNIWERLYSGSLITGYTDPARIIASTRWDSNPALSPDGSKVAFVSDRSGSYELWVFHRDGGDLHQLSHFGGPFTHFPRWSPDGRQLVFVARDEGSVDVFVAVAPGGKIRSLTTAASNDTAPSWSRDGRWIYFASNRDGTWQVWRRPIDDGFPEKVTDQGGYAAFEDPAERYLYYTKRDRAGIWRRPLGGGPEEYIVEGLQPYDWGNWAIGTEGVYYVQRKDEGPELVVYRFEDGSTQSIMPLPYLPKHAGLAVSEDGRTVLYTQIDRIDADLMISDGFQ